MICSEVALAVFARLLRVAQLGVVRPIGTRTCKSLRDVEWRCTTRRTVLHVSAIHMCRVLILFSAYSHCMAGLPTTSFVEPAFRFSPWRVIFRRGAVQQRTV